MVHDGGLQSGVNAPSDMGCNPMNFKANGQGTRVHEQGQTVRVWTKSVQSLFLAVVSVMTVTSPFGDGRMKEGGQCRDEQKKSSDQKVVSYW